MAVTGTDYALISPSHCVPTVIQLYSFKQEMHFEDSDKGVIRVFSLYESQAARGGGFNV